MVTTMHELPPQISAWTKADTIEYLATNPLPIGFRWRHRDGQLAEVRPKYSVESYGKWLHDTPYFQGLFELVHELIVAAGAKLPDIDTIAQQLEQIRREREGQQKLF